MNKISCDVCMDLIPLVKDDIASNGSRLLVEEHIKTCEVCSIIYVDETQVETQMDDRAIANKIKKKLLYFSLAIITLGTLFGISIATGQFMFYNIVIMPIIGAVGYLSLKKKSYYTLVFVFITVYFRWFFDTLGYGIEGEWLSAFLAPLWWAVIYTGLCVMGILIAFLLHLGFRKQMKKTTKIIAIFFASILIVGLLYFANAFVGNPISNFLVNRASDKYIAEHYGDLKLNKEIDFNFKDGNYYVKLSSDTVEDLYFSLYYSQAGKLQRDLYENNITNGWNVISRSSNEYRDKAEDIFNTLKNHGVFENGEYFHSSADLTTKIQISEFPDHYSNISGGIDSTKLELDKKYDVKELGKQGGSLDINISFADLDISYERGAKALLQIKEAFDKADIGFYYISLGVFNSEGNYAYRIDNFPYQEIYEEDLAERIQTAHETNPVSYDK